MRLKVLSMLECCFCLISVARNVARTPPRVNKSSTFQIHQRVMEKRKGFRRQQTHDGDRSPDVSDTTSHCLKSTRDRSTLVRTSQSARRNQKTRLALDQVRGGQDRIKQVSYFAEYANGPNKEFCTPRSAHETRIRSAQSARTQTCSRQSLPSGDGAKNQDRSTTPKRITINDANNEAFILMVSQKDSS